MKAQATALHPFVPAGADFAPALEVDDLDGYWSEIEGKNLARRFPGVRLRPPTEFPWGRELHIVDPAGVCWHIRQQQKR
jgi:predicted enzyme related to lactoylglutathione lyase